MVTVGAHFSPCMFHSSLSLFLSHLQGCSLWRSRRFSEVLGQWWSPRASKLHSVCSSSSSVLPPSPPWSVPLVPSFTSLAALHPWPGPGTGRGSGTEPQPDHPATWVQKKKTIFAPANKNQNENPNQLWSKPCNLEPIKNDPAYLLSILYTNKIMAGWFATSVWNLCCFRRFDLVWLSFFHSCCIWIMAASESQKRSGLQACRGRGDLKATWAATRSITKWLLSRNHFPEMTANYTYVMIFKGYRLKMKVLLLSQVVFSLPPPSGYWSIRDGRSSCRSSSERLDHVPAPDQSCSRICAHGGQPETRSRRGGA